MAKTTGSSVTKWLYFIAGALVAGPIGFTLYHFMEAPGADTSAGVEISISEDGIRVDEN